MNYDGVAKHHTTVGDHVRIGSDTMLVAPVTVGDGAYTAAGSVITSDVPPGADGRRAGAPAQCGRLGTAPPPGYPRCRGCGGGRGAGRGPGTDRRRSRDS